LFPIN